MSAHRTDELTEGQYVQVAVIYQPVKHKIRATETAPTTSPGAPPSRAPSRFRLTASPHHDSGSPHHPTRTAPPKTKPHYDHHLPRPERQRPSEARRNPHLDPAERRTAPHSRIFTPFCRPRYLRNGRTPSPPTTHTARSNRMTTTTCKLAAAKLNDANGIPDDVADSMYRKLGSKHMAIVELEVFEKTDGLGDTHRVVRLRPIHLELATGDHANHLRELSRGLYAGRQPRGLDQLDEEDTDEIIRRGRNKLLLCDICLHKAADDRISHAPDVEADGAECNWKDTNLPVTPGEDDEPAEYGTPDEIADVQEEGPESIDEPWPGDPDYTPPADDQEPVKVGAVVQ